MTRQRVLFLCTGNSARSQMAEAVLRREAGDRFEVHSAGLEPRGLNPLTLEVMNEAGYDLSTHTSKSVDVYAGQTDFAWVITVCGNAEERCPIFPGAAQKLHWVIDDPAATQGSPAVQLAAFRMARAQIEAYVRSWLAQQPVA